MAANDKIKMDVFKLISRSITDSANLETMCNQMPPILVSALEIKGATLFALNPESSELEILGTSGLSANFVNKGPVLAPKSIGWAADKEPVTVGDVSKSDRLQYPENAKEEGICAIVSVPVIFSGKIIGALRLYHGETWEISQNDLDALHIVAASMGMVMMYGRILNALYDIRSTANDVHDVWFEPAGG